MRLGGALLFSMTMLGALGCKGKEAPAIHSKQYIVVVDLSASRDGSIRAEDQRFVERLSSELGYGDRVVLMQMQQANLSDHPVRLPFEMPMPRKAAPTPRDAQALAGEQQTVADSIPQVFRATGDAKVQHTDIFATMQVVSEKMREKPAGAPTTIIVLSDMLQSAQGWEMERLQRMTPLSWIDERSKAGQLPRLDGACVAVIGEDASLKWAATVSEFWQAYFHAAGASLSPRDIRGTAPISVQSLCQGA